jgi:tripartite-type tricarboxylate transporter receptor subunit TctC
VKTWFAALLLLPCLHVAGLAENSYPERPITLIVTAAAGGVTDVAARAVGQELSKAWGQPVIVENRGGAAHILGAQSVAKADPDGYTLLVGEAGTFTINPTVYPPGKLPYDTDKDFVPISGLVRINQALIADNNLPAKNAAELIALAKQKPGALTYGTAGIGSAPHMNMALFESMAGVKLQAVHYRGAAPALNDLAGGSVNLMSVSVSLALPAFRGGRVKILGIGSERRIAQAPDIPTVAETGLPGYQAVTWFGLFGPSKLPRDIVTKLNTEVTKIFADADFRSHFLEPQMFEAMPSSPEEFAAYIKTERDKWAKVIHEAHITLE